MNNPSVLPPVPAEPQPPACVATLNVLMIVLPDGRVQSKIEHWKADPLALDLLINSLPGIAEFLKQKRSLIVRPAGASAVVED